MSQEFKIGDVVLATKDKPEGLTGNVIAVCPERKKVVVEFPGWIGGHEAFASKSESEPWFPEEFKTPSKSRWNFWGAQGLELIRRGGSSGERAAKEDGNDVAIREEGGEVLFEGGERTRQALMNGGRIMHDVLPVSSQWLHFRPGDIITSFGEGSCWLGKKVQVKGFSSDGALIGHAKSFSGAHKAREERNELALIERPGWRFKVGDRVKVLTDSFSGFAGEVIFIHPTANYCYLVDLGPESPEDSSVHSAEKGWGEDWFPDRYKLPGRYFWFEEHELEPLVA